MDPYITLNCHTDETFFIENYFTIHNPFTGRKSSPVDLFPKQHNLIDQIDNEQIIIDIITERQVGTTTIFAGHALWLAMFNSFMNVGMMGQLNRHGSEFRRMVHLGYDNLPTFMQEKITVDNAYCTEFANGSRIHYLNSDPVNLRGRIFDCIIMDTFEHYTPSRQTELYEYADRHYGGQFKQIALL